jgi:hypothetical protein
VAKPTKKTQGNDACRKITKALREYGGSAVASTVSELRRLLGLVAMSTRDLVYNLQAMYMSKQLEKCVLTPGSVEIALAGTKSSEE